MYVKVHVYPGMKKEQITSKGTNHFEIVTKVNAERNAANDRVRAMIAQTYGVPVHTVRIVTGHRSPSKVLEVSGL